MVPSETPCIHGRFSTTRVCFADVRILNVDTALPVSPSPCHATFFAQNFEQQLVGGFNQ